MVAHLRTRVGLLASEVIEVEVPPCLAVQSPSSMAVYDAWEAVGETPSKHRSLATFDSGYWLCEVPFDPTIVMVPLVHNETGRILKHNF